MLYRRAIFVDEMRILCRIIGGSHTIKSYSKLTPSLRIMRYCPKKVGTVMMIQERLKRSNLIMLVVSWWG